MRVPQELLAEFAKITKDETKTKTEKIVYGTIVEENDVFYVQFDGSELLTPMTTTVDVQNGDRVSAMIKNHMVVVTGNISSPAARTVTVNNVIKDIEDVNDAITNIDKALDVIDDDLTAVEEDVQSLKDADSEIKSDIQLLKDTDGEIKSDIQSLKDADSEIKSTLDGILDKLYPVGSVYISVNEVDPATLFGGSWERIKDVFLLGYSETYPLGSTGGEASHILTVDEMPTHEHTVVSSASMTGGGDGTDVSYILEPTDIGGGQAHNNMPPYLAVNMWKRIA